MNLFANRMIRAAKLDAQLYEEVEADKNAMGQAMGVVLLLVWRPVSELFNKPAGGAFCWPLFPR